MRITLKNLLKKEELSFFLKHTPVSFPISKKNWRLVKMKQFLTKFLSLFHLYISSLFQKKLLSFSKIIMLIKLLMQFYSSVVLIGTTGHLKKQVVNEIKDVDTTSTANTTSEIMHKNISENLLVYQQPGLYRIQCLTNGKVYIGESDNVFSRLEIHVRGINQFLLELIYSGPVIPLELLGSHLKKNIHENAKIQKDFNKYKIENFAFFILYIGPEWKDRSIRLKKENEILLTYKPDEVYNNHSLKTKKQTKNFRYTCQIHGKHYESVYQASGVRQSIKH